MRVDGSAGKRCPDAIGFCDRHLLILIAGIFLHISVDIYARFERVHFRV